MDLWSLYVGLWVCVVCIFIVCFYLSYSNFVCFLRCINGVYISDLYRFLVAYCSGLDSE